MKKNASTTVLPRKSDNRTGSRRKPYRVAPGSAKSGAAAPISSGGGAESCGACAAAAAPASAMSVRVKVRMGES